MKRMCFCVVLVLATSLLGCGGSDKIVLPTDKLTPEQEAKVKVEDKNIDDEESQGKKKAK
jgi:predicted small lipoprotein YifL